VAAGLNVRAVVLPDGHDPDSYAKAFGSEDLEKYLKTHTQDFIAFKAGLAAEEAAGDPIKRAESIDSILETISLVPDVIKRSVFVAEAARLFKMSEEALTESLNTRIYERLRKPKPRFPSSEEPPVLPPLDEMDNPYTQAFEQQRVTPLMELEQGLIRSLILFGHKPIEDDYLIAHYILEQVSELELKTDVLQKLRSEYADRLDFGDDMSPDFFLHHPEELIKRMVIDLCAEFYQLSPNWENKYKIFIPTEEDLLSTALYANILRLKKQHVLEEIKELELILDNPSEEVDDMEILKEWKEKKEVEMAISKELGSVMN
jgi:DNA primase